MEIRTSNEKMYCKDYITHDITLTGEEILSLIRGEEVIFGEKDGINIWIHGTK